VSVPPKRRCLVVTLDAAGNWPPERALVRALIARGHEVRVLSNAKHERDVVAAGAQFRAHDRDLERDPTVRRDETPEAEMARVFQDVFLNRRYAEALLAEARSSAPDVLLVDQMLLMAAAAAESTRLPTALLWHTVFGGRVEGAAPMPSALLDPLNAYRRQLGLARTADRFAAAARADAILAFTYEEFDTVPRERPQQLHYVGPLLAPSSVATARDLPWDSSDPRPLVLVSFSTTFQDQVSLLQRVADAVAELPVQVVMTLGPISPDELSLPPTVVARAFVDHRQVMASARLVVTHAGHGTVMAAVTSGVPMVCTPMGRDQHAVAGCVARRGLGVVVPATASSQELKTAIEAVLADGALQARTQAFAAALDPVASSRRAIDAIERLDTDR
jgi:MGT family glycosyltransferase